MREGGRKRVCERVRGTLHSMKLQDYIYTFNMLKFVYVYVYMPETLVENREGERRYCMWKKGGERREGERK